MGGNIIFVWASTGRKLCREECSAEDLSGGQEPPRDSISNNRVVIITTLSCQERLLKIALRLSRSITPRETLSRTATMILDLNSRQTRCKTESMG